MARKKAYNLLAQRQKEVLARQRAVATRQAEIRARAANPAAYAPRPENPSSVSADDRAERDYRARQQAASRQKSIAFRQQTEARERAKTAKDYWVSYDYAWKKRRALSQKGAGPDETGFNPATYSDRQRVRDLEDVLREESNRTKDGRFDPATVRIAQERYEAITQRDYEHFRDLTVKLQDKLKTLGPDATPAQYKAAKKLYDQYLKELKEFQRRYGDGTDAAKEGSYSEFYKNMQTFATGQREWVKNQTRAHFEKSLERMHPNDPNRKDAQLMLDVMNGKVKPGLVADPSKPGGFRQRTMEEELDHRAALVTMRQEKLHAEMERMLAQDKMTMDMLGLVYDDNGRPITIDQRSVDVRAKRVRDQFYGGQEMETINLATPKAVQEFVGHIIDDWVISHPRPNAPLRSREMYAWNAALQAFQKQAYARFGSGVPNILEKVLTVPGISHGAAILQGANSLIGTAQRLGYDQSTGKSVIPSNWDWAELPTDIKKKIGLDGPLAGLADIGTSVASSLPGGQLFTQARMNVIAPWLKTKAGKAWWDERQAGLDERNRVELSEFLKAFEEGDAGGKLDALNQFGSRPFQSENQNLLFQMLADPTNVIPLNFTKYLARGKYALDVYKQSEGGVSNALKAANSFRAVDEGTLKLESDLRKFRTDLKAKGLTPEQAAHIIREELVGLTDDAAKVAFRKKMVEMGLDPAKLSETQVYNLAIQAAKKRLPEDADFMSQSRRIAEEGSAIQKGLKEAEARRLREKHAEGSRVKVGDEKTLSEGEAAADRLATERSRQRAATFRKAAREKAKPRKVASAAAAEPVGKAPSPAKPVRPRVKKAPDGPENRVRNDTVAQIESTIKEKGAKRPAPKEKRIRAYEGWREYYISDPLGNRLPRNTTLVKNAEYRALIKKAKAGDKVAAEKASNIARLERINARVALEDEFTVKDSKFTPSEADFFERAGVSGDEAAQRVLRETRKSIRYLRRLAGRQNINEGQAATIRRFTATVAEEARPVGRKKAHPVTGRSNPVKRSGELPKAVNDPLGRSTTAGRIESEIDIVDNLPSSGTRLEIGADILEARANSLRGAKDVYEAFTGHSMAWYKGQPGIWKKLQDHQWVQNISTGNFRAILHLADRGRFGEGIAGFRDGGQVVFEVFHRLRREHNWEKLGELNTQVDAWLLENPDSLFAYQWKVMWDRAGLGSAGHWATMEAGFKQAAESWGIHPDLALAAIPNGYYAQRPPLTFGLRPKLQGMLTSPHRHFSPAPERWGERDAARAITDIFRKGVGEASPIVHYVAERFGDFVKATPLVNRIYDEMALAAAVDMGVGDLTRLLVTDYPGLMSDLVRQARRRGDPASAPVSQLLEGAVRRFGPNASPRLDRVKGQLSREQLLNMPELRDAIEAAYWDGKLTIKNPKAHSLMYLAMLQTKQSNGGFVTLTRRYFENMRALGDEAENEARDIIRSIHFDRIERTANMVTREMDRSRSFTEDVFGAEAELYLEMGLMPNMHRIRAHAKRMEQEAKRIEEELAEQAKRDTWLNDGDAPMNAYTGTQNTFDVHERLLDSVTKYKATGDKRYYKLAEGEVFAMVDRIVATGAARMSHLDFEELASVAESLEELPAMLDRLGRHLSDYLLTQRKVASREPLAYQDALLTLKIRAMETGPGLAKPGFAGQHAKALAELAEVRDLRAGSAAGRMAESAARIAETEAVLTRPSKIRGKLSSGEVPEAEKAALRKELPAAERAAKKLSKEIRDARTARSKEYETQRDGYLEQHDADSGGVAPEFPDDVNLSPNPHTPEEMMPTTATDILLYELTHMTEEQWWAKAREDALRQINSTRTSAATKAKARQTLNDIAAAKLAKRIEAERKTPRATGRRRRAWVRKVDRSVGERSEGLISPKMIAPFARTAYSSTVEQARTYYRLLRSAAAGPVLSSVHTLGPALKEDHFPKHLFDEVEQKIAAAIREHRGWSADTRTRGRRPPTDDASEAVGKMSDKDPAIVSIKSRILHEYGISLEAYDEARAVLWKGYVQDRTTRWLQKRTDDIVARTGADWNETFLKLREKEAKLEARRQLAALSSGDMFGFDPEVILAEFVARYSDDGTLRSFTPQLSVFQRKTLEANVRAISGVADIDDPVFLKQFFQTGEFPPFEKGREAVRDWLVKHGAWSPRTADQFATGKKTWSIDQEADYWRTNFGHVPEWADRKVLSEVDEATGLSIFSDPDYRYLKYREWGMFGKSVELKHRLDGESAKRLEEAHITGDESLDIKATRELELQRKYAVERYGDLVGHQTADGEYVLHDMPDLMTSAEFKLYRSKRAADGLAPGIIKDAEEQAYIEALIEDTLDANWQRIQKKIDAGEQITHEDIAREATEVQKVVLADPKFEHRGQRLAGRALDRWTGFQRWQVFSNPSFLVMNVADVPFKTALYRSTRGGLFHPDLGSVAPDIAARAKSLTPQNLGIDLETTAYSFKQKKSVDYMKSTAPKYRWAKKVGRVLSFTEGAIRAVPEYAGRAELAGKMWLAQGMYPQVYTRALRELKDPELAHAFALRFIKKEVDTFWPTASNAGPIEQFFNRLVPFASYMVRNKVLFIREALAHPHFINKIEYIGRHIERVNRERWAEEHPDEEFPERFARRIELPWAPPGYFLDISQLSDAGRGLKPLLGQSGQVHEVVSGWLRLMNPGTQALFYSLTNAFGLTQSVRWRPVVDEDGFPTGEYEKVLIGWTEPWSNEQPGIDSVFWFMDALKSGQEMGADGFTEGEMSQIFGQVFMFGAIDAYDKGAAYFTFYNALKAKSKTDAKKWLEGTPEGRYLDAWFAEKRGELERSFNPYKGSGIESWYFKQDKGTRARIEAGDEEIKRLRASYGNRLLALTERTAEYKALEAEMYAAINGVYLKYPEMLAREVYSKTPAEWAKDMPEWQVSRLTDAFFDLQNSKPVRADFKTGAEFSKAVAQWEYHKTLFLMTHPQVKDRLADDRAEVQMVRDRTEAEWDRILGNVAERTEAIKRLDEVIKNKGYEAAEKEQAERDMLYLQNELDFNLLGRDAAATYFDYNDFHRLGFNEKGPLQLKDNKLVKLVVNVLDFDSVRLEKAKREGKELEFLKQQEYGQEVRKASLYAKGGHPLGKFDPQKWTEYMEKNDKFRAMYHKENPDKKKQWDANKEYIREIGKWGRLVGASRWDEAARVWDSLPLHVRQRYLDTHPDARIDIDGDFVGGRGGSAVQYNGQWFKSAASRDRYISGSKYYNAISPWGKAAAAGDWDKADAIWSSLPQWVKDRYRAKHPLKARSLQTTQYLGYMDKWVKLFDSPDKNAAMKYFNSLPEWAKERYFKKHPENRVKFETSAKMGQKLAYYFASSEAAKGDYLKANPDLQKWLAQNANTEEMERISILQAYRMLPKEDAWLRRVFREKYPEIFSQEGQGERRLNKVYDRLSAHPEMLPEFEKWVDAIWGTYAEMLMKGQARPLREVEMVRKVPARKYKQSLSAAQTSV